MEKLQRFDVQVHSAKIVLYRLHADYISLCLITFFVVHFGRSMGNQTTSSVRPIALKPDEKTKSSKISAPLSALQQDLLYVRTIDRNAPDVTHEDSVSTTTTNVKDLDAYILRMILRMNTDVKHLKDASKILSVQNPNIAGILTELESALDAIDLICRKKLTETYGVASKQESEWPDREVNGATVDDLVLRIDRLVARMEYDVSHLKEAQIVIGRDVSVKSTTPRYFRKLSREFERDFDATVAKILTELDCALDVFETTFKRMKHK